MILAIGRLAHEQAVWVQGPSAMRTVGSHARKVLRAGCGTAGGRTQLQCTRHSNRGLLILTLILSHPLTLMASTRHTKTMFAR